MTRTSADVQAKEVTSTGSREQGFQEKEKGEGVGGVGGSQIESRVEMESRVQIESTSKTSTPESLDWYPSSSGPSQWTSATGLSRRFAPLII